MSEGQASDRGLAIHQLAEIRSAILTAIDGNYWTFYENDLPPDPDEPTRPREIADQQRLDFCDAVQRLLVEREQLAKVER